MTTIVLVHGAWHGSWCFDSLRRELSEFEIRTLDLPSVGGEQPADLFEDADALRTLVAQIEGPVLVVAHSYGGAVATQALTGLSNVVHIGYLCAFALAPGESLFGAIGGQLPDWVEMPSNDWIDVTDPTVFYNGVSEQESSDAASRLRPQAAGAFMSEITRAAWQDIASTYVVCTEDRAVPPEAQRQMAARMGARVHEIATSHSPFLSDPGVVADLIRGMLAGD